MPDSNLVNEELTEQWVVGIFGSKRKLSDKLFAEHRTLLGEGKGKGEGGGVLYNLPNSSQQHAVVWKVNSSVAQCHT